MIELTGLWKNTDKNGEMYLGGSLGPGVKVFVFPNKHKSGDRDPDYSLHIAPAKREEDNAPTAKDEGDAPF